MPNRDESPIDFAGLGDTQLVLYFMSTKALLSFFTANKKKKIITCCWTQQPRMSNDIGF